MWHYPMLAQHREVEIYCEIRTVHKYRSRPSCRAWRECKMACHGRENSAHMRISRKCTISLRTARALREPFYPGWACGLANLSSLRLSDQLKYRYEIISVQFIENYFLGHGSNGIYSICNYFPYTCNYFPIFTYTSC